MKERIRIMGIWLNEHVIELAIIWIIIGFILLFVYLGIYHNVTWNVLTGFATWVLAGGVFCAFYQIQESRKSTNAQIAIDMYEELRSEESLETLRFIYDLNPANPEIVFNSDKYRIEYLLDRFNFLSILVKNGIVNRNLAIDSYAGASFLKCWYVLHSFVNDIREDRNRKSYCYPFEGFTNLCMEDFKDRGITVGLKNRYCKVDDLVIELLNAKDSKEQEKKQLYPKAWDQMERDWKQPNSTKSASN
jgi:hypothetical protein